MPLTLENVLGYAFNQESLTIHMRYFGQLSDNRRMTRSKTGATILRSDVKKWMNDLSMCVKLLSQHLKFEPPIQIRLDGHFKDKRYPDLCNLHWCIANSLKVGLGIDDKHFRFQDGDVITGAKEPKLVIRIE